MIKHVTNNIKPVMSIRSNDEEVLSQSIGEKTYKSDGEIDCIGFSFARHGCSSKKEAAGDTSCKTGLLYVR